MRETVKIILSKFFVRLALVLSLGLTQAVQADECDGPGCGGGGTKVNGITVDRYLARSKVRNKNQILSLISPRLQEIRKVDPELAAALEKDVRELDWYLVDKPVRELSFTRTKVPIHGAQQVALQFDDNVFIYRAGLRSLKTSKDKSDLIMHELFMRHLLLLEGGSKALTMASVWKAVDLVTRKSLPKQEELRRRLQALGFGDMSLTPGNPAQAIRQLAAKEELEHVDIGFQGTITVHDARNAQEQCLLGTDDSVFRNILSQVFGSAEGYQFEHRSWNFDQKLPLDLLKLDVENLVAKNSIYSRELGTYRYGTSSPADHGFLENGMLTLSLSGNSQSPCDGCKKVGPEENKTYLLKSTMIRAPLHWPSIQYEIVENDSIYDRFGHTNENLRLRNLSVVIAKRMSAEKGRLKFYNAHNGFNVGIEVDGNKYVDCLKRELNARARTPVPQEINEDRPDGSVEAK